MKKHFIIFFITLIPFLLKAQVQKHSVYVISNFNLALENSLYIDFDDPDFEVWTEPENTFSFGLGYTYGLNQFLGVGLQMEVEKIKVNDYYLGDDASVNRLAYGFHFLVKYPENPIHAVGGGFFNLGGVNSDDFDNKLFGIEYGAFIGPEYSVNNFDISILFHPKFSSFYSKEESPDAGLIMYPRLSLKVSYNLDM